MIYDQDDLLISGNIMPEPPGVTARYYHSGEAEFRQHLIFPG
jgi:hypothetical protein